MVQEREPASLQEAKKYIGQTIIKLFDAQEYKGTVQEIDTELDTGDGVETGLFFRILYEDDDEEHLVWSEFVKWNHARKKVKGSKGGKAGGSGGAAADVAAVNDRTSNKRQRRSGASQQEADHTPRKQQQQQDAADSEQYEQPVRGSGGQSAGSKRRRASANQQQQQQQELKQEDEESPAPAPVTASLRKNPRKSAKPRMAVVSPQQQQQQQQRGRKKPAAAAAGSDSDGEQEEEEDDAVEGDEESGGGEEYTPQKQQQRPSKKARTGEQQQKQQQRRRPSAAAAAADEEMEDAAAAAAAAAAEEDEEEEEEMDEELEREVAREQAAYEAQQARPRHVVVRQQGNAGHLKHVQVVNFMCHHNFAMDFGTHVNVISGRNGSGKSAVLQAMQAALGSKAKDTGRGDNFRELVRTGCHEARVKVTLWNTGEDAYQHGVYGDWITIERIIKTAGGTQYKLINSAGKKVGEGYKSVAALLDHLNVDAANPLAVLTQDTARNFLCGSVADKKKYEIFMKATCLQTMYDYLVKASGYVEEMKEAFKGIREEHDARKAKVDEIKEKLAKLLQSASLVEQRALYDRAVFWAAVKVQQDKRDSVNQVLTVKAPELLAKYEAALAKAKADLEEIKRKDEELIAAQEAEQEETRNFTEAMTALASQLKAAKAVTRGKQTAAKKLEQKLQGVQKEMKSVMEAKRETNDDRQREYEEKLQHHETQMAQARQALAQAEGILAEASRHKEGMRDAIAAKDQEVMQLKHRVQSEQATLNNLQGHMHTLQQAKGQKLQMFGAHAVLRRMVDQNIRKFSKPPIGPIGAHLTLTDTKWATAGEVVLGGSLELWIVHNAKDNQTLRGMARQVQGISRFVAIVSSFDRQRYTIPDSKRLRPGWRNLREFIKIDHPNPQAQIIIDNKLMDETHFEVVVVHEEEDKCRDAIYNNAAGAGVGRAVHASGLNFTKGRNNTIISSRFYSRGAPRIGASFEDDMSQTQHLLQQSQARLSEAQQQLTAANAALQQLNRQMQSINTQEKQAIGAKSRAAHKVQQLQAQAPVLEVDEGDGEDLVAEQLRGLQEQANDLQMKHEKAAMELQEAKLKEDQAKKLYDDRQSEMQQTLSQMNDRTEALDKLLEQKETANKLKAEAEKRLAGVAAQKTQLEAKLVTYNQLLDTAKEAALKDCSEEQGFAALQQACESLRAELEARLRPKMQALWNRDQLKYSSQQDFEAAVEEGVQDQYSKFVNPEDGGSTFFQKKSAQLDKVVTSAEREAGGTKEELEHNLRKAEAEFNVNAKSVRNMSTVVSMCDKAVSERWKKYDELFTSVSETVSAKFMGYMHRRGHHGRVAVNSDTGELKLLVKINAKSQGAEAKKSKAVKDLKQLSGGERSFTTVAFILALGKFTESPFRAMDEYDVFMDAVNRRIATQTLLEFALEENNLQFVLLTPQDLQAVEDAKRHLAASKGGQDLPDGFVKVVQMRLHARAGRRTTDQQQQQKQQQRRGQWGGKVVQMRPAREGGQTHH